MKHASLVVLVLLSAVAVARSPFVPPDVHARAAATPTAVVQPTPSALMTPSAGMFSDLGARKHADPAIYNDYTKVKRPTSFPGNDPHGG